MKKGKNTVGLGKDRTPENIEEAVLEVILVEKECDCGDDCRQCKCKKKGGEEKEEEQ